MEFWDIYDSEKKLTGRRVRKDECILEHGEYHLSVLGVIRRPDGRYIITKRKEDKAWAPGWWEVPGGAVLAGESSLDAVIREVKEETGLDVSSAEGGFAFDYHRESPESRENYFVDIYLFHMDFSEEDVVLQKEEATEFKLAKYYEIEEIAKQGIFLHFDSIKEVFEERRSPDEKLDRLFDFFLEIDKEKLVSRRNYLADGSRFENDVEHAWHMAVMAYLLKDYANEEIDLAKAMMMALTHDLVEIYAGDTYAFDENAKKDQEEREQKAADKLYSIPGAREGAELRGLWEEFESRSSPEARFIRALDNLQPLILNWASKGRSWRENGIKLSQLLKRNEKTVQGSEKLWDYVNNRFVKAALEAGYLTDDVSGGK